MATSGARPLTHPQRMRHPNLLPHDSLLPRGWKTREGRPRLGASAPRTTGGGGGGGGARQRRGVVPAELAATRDLRAMIGWPGLLELLEEEGVESVPTDGVRYWLARLGAGFQVRLATAGVLCADTSVHHIIARSSRGIDHPLNYFLIDKGPNSAMGSRVEGFRGGHGGAAAAGQQLLPLPGRPSAASHPHSPA